MKKRKLLLKVFARLFFLLLISSVIILYIAFGIITSNYNDLAEGCLRTKIDYLVASISLRDALDPVKADSLIKKTGDVMDVHLTLVLSDGKIIGDSRLYPSEMENIRFLPEINEAIYGQTAYHTRIDAGNRKEVMYIAAPLLKDGEVAAILRGKTELLDFNGLINYYESEIILIYLILILLSVLGAYFIATYLTNPIEDFVKGLTNVSAGDFKTKIFFKTKDEINELALVFNNMTNTIKDLFAQVSSEKEELNSIISSITEGLILLDKEGKIMMANKSFEAQFEHKNVIGKFYWEIIREPVFTGMVEKCYNAKVNYSGEMTLMDKEFLCSITNLTYKDEKVLIFHDVSQLKYLAKVKKDFISNVSHELRTPLTAIKGFVETLKEDEDREENQRYLEIIDRHTHRLINIVKDLLILSNLEESNLGLEIEELDVSELIRGTLRLFNTRLEQKELDLITDIPPGKTMIQGDFFKLEQIFINLIDNAIKYTDKGFVKIKIQPSPGEVVMSISDTGVGIPRKDLARIFERFYVVDKSRTKKTGGTGLGLSIVKHIVYLHNGKLDVKSEPGKGTEFIITLPTELELSA